MFKIFINDGSKEIPKDDICYIIGKSGIFLKKKVGLIESIAPVKEISILEDIPPIAKINIPKIHEEDFAKILDFFKIIYEAYSAEAIVLVFYNIEKELYKFECPIQEVSAASLHYETMTLKEGYNLIGTIHSHGSMSAFHSGTDDHDEKNFDGLHITIGKVNNNSGFDISCSVVANGTRVINNPLDYIDGVEKVEENIVIKNATNVYMPKPKFCLKEHLHLITCNEFWFNNVKEKVVKVYGFLSGGYGNYFSNFGGVVDKKYYMKDYIKERDKIIDKAFKLEDFDEDNFSPCEDCPFKNYKLEMMLEEIEDEVEEDKEEDDFYGYDLPYVKAI